MEGTTLLGFKLTTLQQKGSLALTPLPYFQQTVPTLGQHGVVQGKLELCSFGIINGYCTNMSIAK